MNTIHISESDLRKLIRESVVRVLKEEDESRSSSKVADLISFLHNAQLPVREIHWNTRNNALHLLTDETIDELLDWEDRLAETYLGGNGGELKINEKKPESSEYDGIMNDLIDLANEVRESLGDNREYGNINAIIDEILETANKNLYRGEFK